MNEDRRPTAATAPAETPPPAKDRIAEIKARKRTDDESTDGSREKTLEPRKLSESSRSDVPSSAPRGSRRQRLGLFIGSIEVFESFTEATSVSTNCLRTMNSTGSASSCCSAHRRRPPWRVPRALVGDLPSLLIAGLLGAGAGVMW